MVNFPSLVSFILLAASAAVAHPVAAPLSKGEVTPRAEFQRAARRSLGNCQDTLHRRGHLERSAARRRALADDLRRKRGLPTDNLYKRLSLDDVLNTSHLSNETDLTVDTNPFEGNASCVLNPETTEGPYYVDGEYVRSDITEDQEGVYTYVDVELIDVSTCEPVSNVYIDFWHCNATGVYAGVVASGNGDSSDESNLNKTFLRGIQPTNDEGYAQFETIFPGHYTSRATHIHVVAHSDGTVLTNGTFKTDTVRHVGQLFFDQDLITIVEATSPYLSNTQVLTTNDDDTILTETVEDETNGVDPVLEYVYLGDDVSDGLLAWGSVGIDLTASYSISAAATLTEDGGVENESSLGGGDMGALPSGSDFLSGAIPSSTGELPGSSVVPSSTESSSSVSLFSSSSSFAPAIPSSSSLAPVSPSPSSSLLASVSPFSSSLPVAVTSSTAQSGATPTQANGGSGPAGSPSQGGNSGSNQGSQGGQSGTSQNGQNGQSGTSQHGQSGSHQSNGQASSNHNGAQGGNSGSSGHSGFGF
ncbi:aromatic compound dioxygenase [Guyanagaster necrorhizus]|uniref:Aromatic compound dioxygenase n=1 Tax=Guyanagaster necrorhizus TaxID=856835 RepID=A0A9P7VRT0_9AGAR|nr:aromatic compound dioxygenase [Guyanagaster necrorhizus MCA 3950]KAG7445734.1 aromatic compound dioxygenase [Guyanagaster necrorhizus MCA 3950]